MSLDNLPVEWLSVKISDVTVKGEQRKPNDSEEFIYVDIGSINRELKKIENPQFLLGKNAPSRARKVIKQGDVIVSLTRPNLNAVALVGKDYDNQIASTGFEVISPKIVESKYLFNLVRTQNFINEISKQEQGALYPAAKSSDVQAYEFPLPPLAEQQEIVRQLDVMLAQVEQIKARLEAIPAILKKFRQSVLADAVSGELINQDFSQLPLKSFSDYLTDVRYGTSKKCSESLIEAVPVLRIPNIADDGTLDFTNLKYAEFESKEIKQLRLSKGDLLLIRSNGSLDLVGKSAIADELDRVVLYAGYLIRLRFNNSVNPQFIQYFLQAPQTRQIIENIARSTSGVNNINSKEIASLKIQLPCIDHQNEVVLRVKQLLGVSRRLEETIQSAQKRVNLLTQSILAKAFSGELTVEWRTQHQELIIGINSAESLLAKIQAEREASKPVEKAKKAKVV